ncbi:hypothetical protein HZP39_05495 [Elizabethkingia anophelis]|uniref:hypothetical protein n=1 Tax=Elizabethkingia anophelis TaxID=1117645 RepID=UPI0023E9CEDD|nr:hypothetical protein [Elizabethkingia anophelis]MCT4228952.1 hypothetical protein [Elizabethkingia anophelis]MCT4239678.1 hypothetical protein [Elizabethkingia anophelis]MCT4281751.1 hypothetical protein [Elizabethkingia anophelis]MCT4292336.1 hypothetical protein [Elizabethkingia anophelis]GJN57104.1 hypothetical protein ELAN_06590 [Elizabethkingia anophelis]
MDEKIIIKSSDESLEIQPKNNLADNLKAKAIETTVGLLDAENIAHIVYIDDKFDIQAQKEVYQARMIQLKTNDNYIETERFANIDWSGPIPRFQNLIMQLWDATENKSELLYEVCTHIRDEDSANIIPALEIKNCYGDRIKLMTPDEWIENKYQLIKELEEGKRALCLFDFEFQSGNSLVPGKNGAHLAKSLIEEQGCVEKVLCGIFSHKFTEEDEDRFREEYSTEYGIDDSKLYTISKRRFAFDPQITGFAEGIKNLLLLPYIEQLKTESLVVLEDSNKKAGARIKKMTPKTFNQIIQKSSLKEGIWEISTLFRLYGILSKEENYNMISDSAVRQKFNDSVKKIREIDLKDTGYNLTVPNQQLIKLRNSELYLSGDIINKLHLPLTNGDIFEIKGKEYILLVQPCNLALRAKETECGLRSKNYNNAFLIPLRVFSKEQLNHTKQEILSPDNKPEKMLCAYFPEFKVLSLDYLDLTVFDEKGASTIDMTNPELINDVIHFPWKKRYQYIYEKLAKVENKIQSFLYIKNSTTPKIEEIKGNIRELTKDIKNLEKEEKAKIFENVNPLREEKDTLTKNLEVLEENIYSFENFDSLNLNQINNYDIEKRTFSFDIKRTRHYKSPYSDDLLQNFMLYLSRNAFDHDFTS